MPKTQWMTSVVTTPSVNSPDSRPVSPGSSGFGSKSPDPAHLQPFHIPLELRDEA